MALSSADSCLSFGSIAPPSRLAVPVLTLPALLLSSLLGGCPYGAECLYPSGISANGWTWNWYMAITPFEAVFLNLIMLEIAVLRYLEILPININNLFYGDPSGRRRRRRRKRKAFPYGDGTLCSSSSGRNSTLPLDREAAILESMFAVMQKLDREECLQRTLCQIEAANACDHSNGGSPLPETVQRILTVVKQLRLSQAVEAGKTSCVPHLVEVLGSVQRAVQLGGGSQNSSATCGEKYSLCPLSHEETQFYFSKLYPLN